MIRAAHTIGTHIEFYVMENKDKSYKYKLYLLHTRKNIVNQKEEFKCKHNT